VYLSASMVWQQWT